MYCSYSVRKAIKQAKCQYRDKVDSPSITEDKKKTSQVMDTDGLLPDKLNTFFRFEDDTVQPMRPATRDCGLSFSVADVSKTFKYVNPRKAAGPDGPEMPIPAGWCVYGHIQCPHMLQDGHHCSCTQEGKGN